MRFARLEAPNHRGRSVPRVLGFWLLPAAAVGAVIGALWLPAMAFQWAAGLGCVLVFAAGLVDDLSPRGPRGLRGHLRELAAGRLTTGILKLGVIVASAVIVTALLAPDGTWSRVASVVVIAATTNVFNGLDVRPGRALKWFIVMMAPTLPVGLRSGAGAAMGIWVTSWTILPSDLRERAMLGDSGANLLGFAAGAQLAATLPAWALWPTALVAVVLNVVADTVSFSRLIDLAPPLRWFDRLGRLPD